MMLVSNEKVIYRVSVCGPTAALLMGN